MLEKNQLHDVEITAITSEGSGVCRVDNMAIFVPETAVGDIVRIKIVKVLKSYAFGIVSEILTPSADREERPCTAYHKCGGCVFRHLSYRAECNAKNTMIKDAFSRIGGLNPEYDDFIAAENSDRYRNKAQYPLAYIDGKAVCGFYAPRSHRVIPLTDCPLQPQIFGRILELVLAYINEKKLSVYDERTNTGILRHIYIRQCAYSNEIMLCIVARKNISRQLNSLCSKIVEKFPDIRSIVLNINRNKTNVILGEQCITLWGSDLISDTMCGNKIEISPLSFYQINTRQAEKLYSKALEYASPAPSDVITDLYCGAGTIGLSMAHKVNKLIGIEIIPSAIENAEKNAVNNHIGNADFYCGDAGKIFAELYIQGLKPNIIIVDPPRKGCSENTLTAILNASPSKIIMISCNPSTAARDAKFLSQHGYSVNKVCGADLFPGTRHVECVVLLTRNNR